VRAGSFQRSRPSISSLVAVVITSALMIGLRLIGILGVDQPLKRVSARFLPFIWWPLLLLLATGTVMIVGEPARSLKNPVFQLKMSLLVVAIIVTRILQSFFSRGSRDRPEPSWWCGTAHGHPFLAPLGRNHFCGPMDRLFQLEHSAKVDTGFWKRSCSTNKLERDDDWKKVITL